jgi:hypothetical protein
LRLSYCYPTPERIREGIRRLASVLDAELEIQSTFGPAGPGAHHPSSSNRRIYAPSPDLT